MYFKNSAYFLNSPRIFPNKNTRLFNAYKVKKKIPNLLIIFIELTYFMRSKYHHVSVSFEDQLIAEKLYPCHEYFLRAMVYSIRLFINHRMEKLLNQ